MPEERSRQLTLYVQSRKAVTSFYRPPASRTMGGPGMVGPSMEHAAPSEDEALGAAEEAYFLSDDQAHSLALTEELARERGYKVRVVDVGRAGVLSKLIAEHLRGVQKFPVLVGPTGARLEGTDAFTHEALCEIMPSEMYRLRAFTYVKVRGGDLDRIRDVVLNYPEVRELHMLTGDWDVFVVLEFKDTNTRKREVLDFVTERIRGLPEVVDTSTLVPEYSITKFPVHPPRSGPPTAA
jgi:DNA-binding Lrp family transcriptional regulator